MKQLVQLLNDKSTPFTIFSTINERLLHIHQVTKFELDDDVSAIGSGYLTDIIFAEGFFAHLNADRLLTDVLRAAQQKFHDDLLTRYKRVGIARDDVKWLHQCRAYKDGMFLAVSLTDLPTEDAACPTSLLYSTPQ